MRTLTLLGPQRLQPTLVQEVDRLDIDGPIAIITAGWQERESEDEELRKHLGREVVNLRLHHRLERVFKADPELFQAHRQRQTRLRAIQQLYRYRLNFALEPARGLLRQYGAAEVLDPEREEAIEALRDLDQRQLERIREVHHEFRRRFVPLERPKIAAHRRQIQRKLREVSAVAIAGGHVAVLVNRMRLFGVAELFGDLPIFAWAAGAMALSERIVLFHDSPPQGMGNPEILDEGLGLAPGVVVLPHAGWRLNLEDPARVEILARRFAPAVCVPFDPGEPAFQWGGTYWAWRPETRRLTTDGRVVNEPPETA